MTYSPDLLPYKLSVLKPPTRVPLHFLEPHLPPSTYLNHHTFFLHFPITIQFGNFLFLPPQFSIPHKLINKQLTTERLQWQLKPTCRSTNSRISSRSWPINSARKVSCKSCVTDSSSWWTRPAAWSLLRAWKEMRPSSDSTD